MLLAPVRQLLSNGLPILVIERPHLHVVSVALAVRAGPRYETRATAGLSHFVEHLVFRGTRNHPSSVALNRALESLGAEINGMTQRDALTLHVNLPPSGLAAGLELLGEMATQPTFEGLDVERQVVTEEILETVDANGAENDLDTLSRLALWPGHPVGMPVAGTVRDVEGYTLRAARAHFKRTFVAANAVLVVSGPVHAPEVFAAAERAFRRMPTGRALRGRRPPTPPLAPAIQIQDNEDSQISVLLSLPAPAERDREFSALMLLRRILDDGFSSRLRQAICEQRGLAYSVSAGVDVYADLGALDLDASCAPRKVVATVAQMLSTLKTLAEEGITDDELQRAKIRHQAEATFALDSPEDLALWHTSAALMNLPSSYDDRLREVGQVKRAEVDALARRLFDPRRALLTLVGPVHASQVAKLEQMLGRPSGSTRWLGPVRDDAPEATEVEPIELLGLSQWAQRAARPQKKARAAKRAGA